MLFSASRAATRWARRSRSASLDASAASSSRTRRARAAASGSAGGGGALTAVAGAAAAVGPRPRRPGAATTVAGAATAYRIRSAVVVGGWFIVFSRRAGVSGSPVQISVAGVKPLLLQYTELRKRHVISGCSPLRGEIACDLTGQS